MKNHYQNRQEINKNEKILFAVTIITCIALSIVVYKLSYDYADRKIRNNWESKYYKN